MGLNDIQLPPSLLLSLYSTHLNEGDQSESAILEVKPSATILKPNSPVPEHTSSPDISLTSAIKDQTPSPSSGPTEEKIRPAKIKPAVPADPLPTSGMKSLGSNHQHILILVNYPDAPILPDDELAFLTKMLEACKLSLADVAIVNRHNYPTATPKDYLNQFNSKTVFLFGMDPLSFGLPVSFPAFQVQAVAKTKYLFTPPLEERLKDPLFKSKLWVSLQRIFGI